MNRNVDEIIKQLQENLRDITSPSERVIQMGCFVEIINLSLNDTITKLSNSKLIKQQRGKNLEEFWRYIFNRYDSLIEVRSYLCYAVKLLSDVYQARNKCAHNDPIKDTIEKSCDRYQDTLIEGIGLLIDNLKGWSLSIQDKTFEEILIRRAEHQPYFILINKISRKLSQCSNTFNKKKTQKTINRIFSCVADELGLSLMREGVFVAKEEDNVAIYESHYDFFVSLCQRARPNILSFLKENIGALLQRYTDENIWDSKEYAQYIKPFIERELNESEEKGKARTNLKALYIKLDHDDLTSPGWPQRLNNVRLIPHLRRTEEVINCINDGPDEVFYNSSEFATFVTKRLVPLLKGEIDIEEHLLVVELDGFSLAHEEFYLKSHNNRRTLENLFKSVLIRLTDDPEDPESLERHYIESFIPVNKYSGLINSPIEGKLSDEVYYSPEVVLLAEDAVREDLRGRLYEEIYGTYIPLIVMSLDSCQTAQDLTHKIFGKKPRITLNDLLDKIKYLRTSVIGRDRIPIKLFMDDAEFIPPGATPL